MGLNKNKLFQVIKKFENEKQKKISDYICKQIGAKSFSIKNKLQTYYKVRDIEIDGYKISNVYIDEYNNFDMDVKKPIPIEVLKKFHEVILEYLEIKENYPRRTGSGFLIDYVQGQSKNIDIDYLVEMIKIDRNDKKRKEDGFEDWLIGTGHCSNGNFESYFKFKRELLIKKLEDVK